MLSCPSTLLEAQRDERLVVFVGAGVSVGAPSSLPLFVPLAKQIAQEAQVSWNEETEKQVKTEPDRFLGHLVDRKIDVHRLVMSKIAVPNSAPNALHRSITRLFPSTAKIRIVTTNYDTHLTAAANEVFGELPEIYRAPALPLGRDFSGVVYLHGSVEQQPRQLVVTDSDFGHAYLTDAWAARFLQEMFRNFTVLFIGYSHDDVVMSYLARGLAPDSRPRFGLTSAPPPARWPTLGIQPLCYPSTDNHAALGEAVGKWADLSRMGFLEHEQQIASLVNQPPPEDLPMRSYLERIVTDGATTALFTRHARGDDWLEWAASLPLFRQLFQQTGQLDPAAEDLGRWFADNFVAVSPDKALSTAYQFGGILHPAVAAWAALALWRNPRAGAGVIGRWVPVLLTSGPTVSAAALGMLLSGSCWPEEKDSAVLMLDHLLKPRQVLTPRFAGADARSTDSRIHDLTGEEYALREVWNKFFRPHLDELAIQVAAIAGRHLQQAHLVMRASGQAGDRWDPMSFDRSGIEPHPQDSPAQPFDLLIDIARDCLDALVEKEPDIGAGVIASWAASTAPLLRRLAIYGCARSTHTTADDKLRWAISRELLYDASVKHEFYFLVEQALPGASEARGEFLQEINEGPEGGQADPTEDAQESDRRRAYAIFNLLTWVTHKAPDFAEARAALTRLAEQHPDFSPPEYPDLDLVMTFGFTGPHSPVTGAQVLQMTTTDDVDWMLGYQGETRPGTWLDRFGLMSVIGEAATVSPDWGVKIAGLLNSKQQWDTDLWPVIVGAWWSSAATLTAEQAEAILGQLGQHQSPYIIITSAARLLQALAKRRDLPSTVLDQMEECALRLWDAGITTEAAAAEAAPVNLGTIAGLATDHWAWELAGAWTQNASTRWQADQSSWDGLPAKIKAAISGMLAADGFPAHAAAVAIGANLAFLLAADEPWTTETVLPAFNWEVDSERAASAWAGHLVWGGWNDRVLALLRPYFSQCFSRIASELSDALAVRVASICLYGTADVLASGFLPEYISIAAEDARRKFASTVYEALRKEPVAFAEAQWNKWMAGYWRSRLDSIPRPLGAPEAGEMINWVLTAGRYAPEAAKLAGYAAAEIPSSFLFLRRLKESSFFSDTGPATRLVAHVLSGATDASSACGDIDQVIRLLADRGEPGTRTDLLAACSHAAALGCVGGLSLRAYVESQVPS